jgi:hypothetical protein
VCGAVGDLIVSSFACDDALHWWARRGVAVWHSRRVGRHLCRANRGGLDSDDIEVATGAWKPTPEMLNIAIRGGSERPWSARPGARRQHGEDEKGYNKRTAQDCRLVARMTAWAASAI